jgi:hypothetical protein
MPTYCTAARVFGVATTATGNHWGSIRLSGTASIGTNGELRYGFVSADLATRVAIGTPALDYSRNCGVANLTSTGMLFAVWIHQTNPGTTEVTLNAVLACHGAGSRVPDEVPSQTAAGTGKTRTQGSILTNHDPDNSAGTLDLEQTPRLHGTSAPTSAETLIELGVSEMIGLDGANHTEVEDGTNEANADLVEADGVSRIVRAAWHAADLYAAVVGGDDGTAAYDGAWPAGDVEIKGTCRATTALIIYDAAEESTDPL